METLTWRLPTIGHRAIARLAAEASPIELGAKNLASVLAERLRISTAEACRRIKDAAQLGPRRSISGEPLAPTLEHTATAQARGHIGPEHVKIIRHFFDDLPDAVDYQTRETAEADLARIATGFAPEGLREAANRLMALLHPDGDFSDVDRARKRGISIGRQQADGMSEITGLLDPQARATWDAVMAKWAAPGMCNPEDQSPCVDDEPEADRAERDARSQRQRNHDALTAMGRSVLASGELGQHNGLPATIIVSTTLQDLESGTGNAVTGGGTLLPMSDTIRLASHSHHYLVIYDKHTQETLYLGRTKRIASPGQRIVLHDKDRGCTYPGCTAPGYRCEVHHAVVDWAIGGQTNIDELTFACRAHHRLIKPGAWQTRKRKDGRTEWIPPLHLDTGQTRVNNYHHPDRMLTEHDDIPDHRPDDEDPDEDDPG
jgi:uncharacterized protein DUF222